MRTVGSVATTHDPVDIAQRRGPNHEWLLALHREVAQKPVQHPGAGCLTGVVSGDQIQTALPVIRRLIHVAQSGDPLSVATVSDVVLCPVPL